MAELDAIDGLSAINGAAVTQFGPGLGGAYALANNLFATSTGTAIGTPTVYTNSLIVPGTTTTSPPTTTFTGTMEGLGHTISDLTINAPTLHFIGLFSRIGAGGTARDIGLVGGSVTAFGTIGSLSGSIGAASGVIANSYATMPVTGAGGSGTSGGTVGGLVGGSIGAIVNSHATGNVADAAFVYEIGGLVGLVNGGSITNSYATGTVSGATAYFVGGFVGIDNGATIANSYATGAVSGAVVVGGFAGANDNNGTIAGLITNSYETGAVSGEIIVGGFVGENSASAANATISNAYATGAVSGNIASTNTDIGGFIGGNVSSGTATATIANAYSTGAVSVRGAGAVVGGFAAVNQSTATSFSPFTNVYFDTQTSGLTTGLASSIGAGDTGAPVSLTTAQLQGVGSSSAANLGAAFAGGGAGGTSGLFPYLTSFFPNGVQAISGFAYANGGVTPLASPSGATSSAIPPPAWFSSTRPGPRRSPRRPAPTAIITSPSRQARWRRMARRFSPIQPARTPRPAR
jgi:The GLUG motif